MPLTFAQAKSALESRAPSGKIADYLNRGLERLMVMGGVRGLTEKVTVTVNSTTVGDIPPETLILAAEYSTILGCIIRGVQTGVAAEWYPYQPGVAIDSAGLPSHPITDLGTSPTTGLRSYHVPLFNGDTSLSVTARVRRQHTEITEDEAVMPISDLSALGLSVDAVGYEQNGDFDNSGKYFARAVDILREARKEAEPDFPASSPLRVIFTGEDTTSMGSFY